MNANQKASKKKLIISVVLISILAVGAVIGIALGIETGLNKATTTVTLPQATIIVNDYLQTTINDTFVSDWHYKKGSSEIDQDQTLTKFDASKTNSITASKTNSITFTLDKDDGTAINNDQTWSLFYRSLSVGYFIFDISASKHVAVQYWK